MKNALVQTLTGWSTKPRWIRGITRTNRNDADIIVTMETSRKKEHHVPIKIGGTRSPNILFIKTDTRPGHAKRQITNRLAKKFRTRPKILKKRGGIYLSRLPIFY